MKLPQFLKDIWLNIPALSNGVYLPKDQRLMIDFNRFLKTLKETDEFDNFYCDSCLDSFGMPVAKTFLFQTRAICNKCGNTSNVSNPFINKFLTENDFLTLPLAKDRDVFRKGYGKGHEEPLPLVLQVYNLIPFPPNSSYEYDYFLTN